MLITHLRFFICVAFVVHFSNAIADEPTYWFEGKWFPMSHSYSGDGLLLVRGGHMKWGFRRTSYTLHSVISADVDLPASATERTTILRATLAQKASDGRAWGLGEKERFLVFKPYDEKYLAMYICNSLPEVCKKLTNDGNNYCSTGGFSRDRKDRWRSG